MENDISLDARRWVLNRSSRSTRLASAACFHVGVPLVRQCSVACGRCSRCLRRVQRLADRKRRICASLLSSLAQERVLTREERMKNTTTAAAARAPVVFTRAHDSMSACLSSSIASHFFSSSPRSLARSLTLSLSLCLSRAFSLSPARSLTRRASKGICTF